MLDVSAQPKSELLTAKLLTHRGIGVDGSQVSEGLMMSALPWQYFAYHGIGIFIVREEINSTVTSASSCRMG